jgi:hypothetical protein
MDVVVSPEAERLIRERGGRIYVWTDQQRCCAGATYLSTSSTPSRRRRFQQVDGPEGVDLFVDLGRRGAPDELHLDVGGWRHRRVEAYWNGCVFVT